jgi:nicotinamidase-related amidase
MSGEDRPGAVGRVHDVADVEATARAGFGERLSWGRRPAVIVVDFSRGFTDPAYPTGAAMDEAVTRTAELLKVARASGCPVIFTTIAFRSPLEGGIWLQKAPGLAALQHGSVLVELDPRLEAAPSDPLVVKQGASAFFGTGLAGMLAASRVDTVVVCGATTSGCVRATAVDAMQSGFPAIVPRECVGDRARGPHEASLFDLQAKYADVVEVGEAVDYLQSTTGWVMA